VSSATSAATSTGSLRPALQAAHAVARLPDAVPGLPAIHPFEPPLGWLRSFSHAIWFAWAPLVLLAAAVAVMLLCVSRAWNVGPRLAGRSPGAPALG
jgi:hypothetical protein